MGRVNLKMPDELRDAVDEAVLECKYASVSEFVREAIREKLQRLRFQKTGEI